MRRLLKRYLAFLPRPSQLAFGTGGASAEQLAAAEARLGLPVPWEVWELYRYNDGQAPGTGVFFADDARLLCLDELQLEDERFIAAALPLSTAAPVGWPAAVQLAPPAGGGGDGFSEPRSAPGLFAAPHAGEDPEEQEQQQQLLMREVLQAMSWTRTEAPRLLRFAQNRGSSTRFAICTASARVFKVRGVSAYLVGLSLSAFLERLLA